MSSEQNQKYGKYSHQQCSFEIKTDAHPIVDWHTHRTHRWTDLGKA